MSKISLVAAMALGGLVAFSTLATAQDANKDAKKDGKRGMPSIEQQMDRYNTALTLTDDQKPKVKTALEDQLKAMKALHEDTSLDQDARRAKMQELRKDMDAKMKGILTDDQYKKYQEMSQRGGKKGGKKAQQ
jgi:Spy/CpxP family protein refolding chaperone